MDWIMELPPEVLAALGVLATAIISGLARLIYRGFKSWAKSVEDAIESNKKERDIQLEKMRSDMRIKEDELKADRAEKEQLYAMVRDSIAATNRLTDAIHEDSIARQKLEREIEEARNQAYREMEEARNQAYRENITAILQLKEVLESQAHNYRNMQTALESVQEKTDKTSTSYQNLEDYIRKFLLEVRGIIDNYNDDHAAHVESAGERHKTLNTLSSKVDEILVILKPPPKPPLELPQKLNQKIEDKQEKTG